jgi:hypothetical protein
LVALNRTSPSPKPSGQPAITVYSVVRESFSEARRKALRTQGVMTMQQVWANQATMNSCHERLCNGRRPLDECGCIEEAEQTEPAPNPDLFSHQRQNAKAQ